MNQNIEFTTSITPESIADSSNRCTVTTYCQWCDTKIFLPKAALLMKKEIFLHNPSTKSNEIKDSNGNNLGEVLHNFWVLNNRIDFENVGVSRPIQHQTLSNNRKFRYLTCAACDRGPIGIRFDDEGEIYNVAHERIRFALEKK